LRIDGPARLRPDYRDAARLGSEPSQALPLRFQTADTASRSRGALRPRSANSFARKSEGVGNAGCPMRPHPCALVVSTRSHHRCTAMDFAKAHPILRASREGLRKATRRWGGFCFSILLGKPNETSFIVTSFVRRNMMVSCCGAYRREVCHVDCLGHRCRPHLHFGDRRQPQPITCFRSQRSLLQPSFSASWLATEHASTCRTRGEGGLDFPKPSQFQFLGTGE
jgi:hypothetical protein